MAAHRAEFATDALFAQLSLFPDIAPPVLTERGQSDADQERMAAWNEQLASLRPIEVRRRREARRQAVFAQLEADGGAALAEQAATFDRSRRERRRRARLAAEVRESARAALARTAFVRQRRGFPVETAWDLNSASGRVERSLHGSFAGVDATIDSTSQSQGSLWYVVALRYGGINRWVVHRTYEDFDSLRLTMAAIYPQLAHVPFPRAYAYGETWASVVDERRTGLCAYLAAAFAFPRTPVLDSFLEFSFHVMAHVGEENARLRVALEQALARARAFEGADDRGARTPVSFASGVAASQLSRPHPPLQPHAEPHAKPPTQSPLRPEMALATASAAVSAVAGVRDGQVTTGTQTTPLDLHKVFELRVAELEHHLAGSMSRLLADVCAVAGAPVPALAPPPLRSSVAGPQSAGASAVAERGPTRADVVTL